MSQAKKRAIRIGIQSVTAIILSLGTAFAQKSAMPNAWVQLGDSLGSPCSGCFLYQFAAGSTTPQNTYTTAGGGIANRNPLTLDAAGTANIWLTPGQNYRFDLYTPALVLIRSVDNVPGGSLLGQTSVTANFLLAGPPSGGAATPAFRALVAADIAGLGAGCIFTGTPSQILVVDSFGTGCTGATPTIAGSTITATLAGHATLDLPLAGGTLVGNLLFTDGLYDIGATGATRPRNIFISGSLTGAVIGNASTATALATTRAIYGNNFDGTAALTQVIASTYGGTGNGFTKFSGPASSEKTFTLPNSSATLSYTFASGAKALNTTLVAANACGAAQTDSATGLLTTDVINWVPNADITAITGYNVAGTFGLQIFAYPTADTINFKVCNTTASGITPGSAVTINWRVTR